MNDKMTKALIHFIPTEMLIAAISRWPYGYYMLLRVVVFAASEQMFGAIKQIFGADEQLSGCAQSEKEAVCTAPAV
jgi:hypothetical protein